MLNGAAIVVKVKVSRAVHIGSFDVMKLFRIWLRS